MARGRAPVAAKKRRAKAAAPAPRPDHSNGEHAVEHTPTFAVVGVGASAGGLEAITSILRGIPKETPLALVLVQHMARGHESLLPDLLRNATALTVSQARDGAALEPRHVYVIPPDTYMTVTNGHLRVRPRQAELEVEMPINHFLCSLAEHYRDKAIGVILSGGASDGAVGIREIKAAGGITLAQDPRDAAIDGMPRAAIGTGAVDLVLPAEKIATELVRLATHPALFGPSPISADGVSEDERLRALFELLRRSSGVDFSQYKWPTVMRRIQRRMALHRTSTLDAYVDVVEQNPSEAGALYEDILIHVTGFFREPESFTALRETVFPELLASESRDHPIRVWVPGCSSGEEAYSVAIALLEVLGDRADTIPIQIFGTDVSHKMIEKARAGIYPEGALVDVSPDRVRRFFVKIDGSYRVSKAVRERCIFARQDITRDPPFSRLGLVMCRNLLIYLGHSLQRKAIQVFHYALNANGFLMLGRSETTAWHADLFSLADKRFKIYRKKPASVPAELRFRSPLVADEAIEKSKLRIEAVDRRRADGDVLAEANRMLLDRYAPAAAIVDGHHHVVRTQGRTAPYLELPGGDVTLDVFKLVRPELAFGLREALRGATSRGVAVRKEGLRVRGDSGLQAVNVDVTPLGSPSNRHFLILFQGQNGAAKRRQAKPEKAVAPSKRARDAVVKGLEEELEASRQSLQSIIHDVEATNEELQAANEEILSSNEELQSTNEELDTAKEELQSTNEELSTLNDELQARNEELGRANSDLLNLLINVQIPIVMVSNDLKIRRFTPAAEKQLNLIAADVGRRIGHIKPNIDCPDLEALITEVIDTVSTREREVRDSEGGIYTMRVRPYKTAENRIDGAVLTLFENTLARAYETDLREARECAEALISTVREPILLLDGELRVERANRSFCEQFAVSPDETEGQLVYELGDGQWNIPALRGLLQEVLPKKKNFDGFPVDHVFPHIGLRKMLVDGRRIDSRRAGGALMVLVIRDVTERPA